MSLPNQRCLENTDDKFIENQYYDFQLFILCNGIPPANWCNDIPRPKLVHDILTVNLMLQNITCQLGCFFLDGIDTSILSNEEPSIQFNEEVQKFQYIL